MMIGLSRREFFIRGASIDFGIADIELLLVSKGDL